MNVVKQYNYMHESNEMVRSDILVSSFCPNVFSRFKIGIKKIIFMSYCKLLCLLNPNAFAKCLAIIFLFGAMISVVILLAPARYLLKDFMWLQRIAKKNCF